MEKAVILLMLAVTSNARISVMYAHDRVSDVMAEQCYKEMFSNSKHAVEIEESDEPCLIYCVLKKLGIISTNGVINLDAYRKRVQIYHQLDQRDMVGDFGNACVEAAEAAQHKQDVCRKAKVFNDCTHLYRVLLAK
ncbi:uncharacterized protein LOC106138743 [Amyelois transitella]|uniref:uncharacterized protein LOC106138743 n=1 Tax=Amyelois transitella TaxID=680683 RepID=UPI00067DC5EA|nr:uncharacterized protein LOC106138743 [Amyelois transitella]